MRIAVSYADGMIGAQFSQAEMFAVYDYKNADVDDCVKQLLETGGIQGHQAIAELMRAQHVDAVIAGSMSGEAKAALLSMGIVPIAGFEGSADDAADLLILGRLPIYEGGESCGGDCGGCSGCGGSCSGCG